MCILTGYVARQPHSRKIMGVETQYVMFVQENVSRGRDISCLCLRLANHEPDAFRARATPRSNQRPVFAESRGAAFTHCVSVFGRDRTNMQTA